MHLFDPRLIRHCLRHPKAVLLLSRPCRPALHPNPGPTLSCRSHAHQRVDHAVANIHADPARCHRACLIRRGSVGATKGKEPNETTGNGGAIYRVGYVQSCRCELCCPGLRQCPGDWTDQLHHGGHYDGIVRNRDPWAQLDGDRYPCQGQIRHDLHLCFPASGDLACRRCSDGGNYEGIGGIRCRLSLPTR